jgi:hypothetical protein
LDAAWLDYLTLKITQMNNNGYYNFWKVEKKKEFTEMEIALMEGGHSIEKPKKETYSFIKSLSSKEPTLGPLS